jgi:hypothetical protein
MEEEDGCNQEKGRVNALKREEGGFWISAIFVSLRMQANLEAAAWEAPGNKAPSGDLQADAPF